MENQECNSVKIQNLAINVLIDTMKEFILKSISTLSDCLLERKFPRCLT